MHKYLDQYSLAPDWREEDALQRFPYKQMSAQEYAAREAHNWFCFGYDEYIYSDSELNDWIHTLGDIFFTEGGVQTAREKYLTKEEIEAAEKTENEPF